MLHICSEMHKILKSFLSCDIFVHVEMTRCTVTFHSFILLCSAVVCSQYTTGSLGMRNLGQVLACTPNNH